LSLVVSLEMVLFFKAVPEGIGYLPASAPEVNV